MSKINLNDLANLQNETTAVNTINANNAAIETASDNFLSRDGSTPNTMNAILDMNDNRIINLPQPVGATEPARLQDLDALSTIGGTFTPLPAGGTVDQTLKKNSSANYDVSWGNGTGVTSVALSLPADFTVTGSPITGTGTLGATYVAGTPTGTGTFVRATSPTLVTPDLGTPSAAVLTNATGLPLSGHVNQAAYTFVGNNTSGSAAPTAVDIASLTSKASPAASDYVIISDQAASGAWKKATVSSVGVTSGVSSIAGNIGAFTLGTGLTNSTNDIQVVNGTVIGSSVSTYTANTNLTVATPIDDTIPQITEGTQIITASYTPKLSTSILLAVVSGQIGIGATPDNACIALFNGAANAFASQMILLAASSRAPFCLQGTYAPGSTSAQTISVRVGAAAQTVAMNGNPGTRFLGGSSVVVLTIYEIKA
jgi:hypothetical protein